MRPANVFGLRSLRGRIFLVGLLASVVVVVAVGAFVVVTERTREQLIRATNTFVEEQAIADRINQAVMRQLATASALPSTDRQAVRAEFQQAGAEAQDQIRRYLFQELMTDERLQVEEMREEHQRMEAAAAQAAELFARGRIQEGEAARAKMIDHALLFLDAIDVFLRMREQDLERLQNRQSETFTVIYVGGGIMALFLVAGSLLMVWRLQRRVSGPLAELTAATKRIGAAELDVRVPTEYDEEFATLATGFNRMAERLRTAKDDLERRNEQLRDALSEVETTQAELIQSEKMSAVGRMTAGIAHELNNPLASVLGYAELLAARLDEGDDVPLREVREEYLRPVLNQATRAQHLVRNFLQFSRKSDTDLGPVRLKDAMSVVTSLRAHAFEQAGLRLVVEDLPARHVVAERQLLQGVFLNIVNNAEDAMKPAGTGELRIRGVEEGGTVKVIFEDEGPGLNAPEQVFEPFFTTKPVGEGTGLGLALAHRYMYMFGGSIRAENREDGGARFILGFQVADAPPEEGPPRGEIRAPAAAAVPVGPGSPRILVVEDEAPLRTLQKRLLGRIDATVLLASAADEARRILSENHVDAVISDIKMPGESGLELYDWIVRERPDLAERFLFVTGDVDAPELVTLADERPEIFLHKPFDIREYLARVTAILE